MKFVALVSGGKDSCFSILQCIANNHDLVALANLHPPKLETHEMDSYMYQTVGHNVVAQYSDLLGVPLYRQPINGSAVTQKLDYAPVHEDETEDLFQLLKAVLEEHPEVEAVSVGAILSSYQRTRVENVCQRLGLVSLSYLWQRDQVELLDEIVRSKLDARIIKVAGMGLKPQTHIGKSLAEIQQELLLLHERYGLHPCGEGGEYETLVLGGPSSLFKKKFSIENLSIEEDKADVAFAKMQVVLEDQEPLEGEIVVPKLLEEEFEDLHEMLTADMNSNHTEQPLSESEVSSTTSLTSENIILAGFSGDINVVMEDVSKQLSKLGLTPEYVTSSSLILNEMEDFAKVNKIYSSYFTAPLPPARVCISARLHKGVQCQLSISVTRDLSSKTGLHVQSRSYWAPANIGPYSQTISSGEVTYLSGQIPLVPATMEMVEEPHLAAVLSLQHLVRVSREVKAELATVVGFTSSPDFVPIAEETIKAYSSRIPAVIATVKALPRNAPVEWAALAYKSSYYLGQRENTKLVRVTESTSISSLLQSVPASDMISVTLFATTTALANDINTALEVIQCDTVNCFGEKCDAAVLRYRQDVDVDSD
ncbi:Diphthine--ammonia ligase [Yarrowia sp. B02]|nr:Diphthine--ammonia ligase [Yarrowia sp. B02]